MSREKSDTLQADKIFGDYSRDVPQEIRSGAIIQDPDTPDCYLIDANTAQGFRRFRYAQEVNKDDAQSEEGPLTFKCVVFEKKFRYPREVFRWPRIREGGPRRRPDETEPKKDVITPDVLIRKIVSETASHEEKRRAVIESEVVAFPPESVGTLNRLLYLFVKQYRDSDDQQDIVAVGSAIRKYVATMDRADLSALAILLDAEHNATVPIEVELEVAKTLVRKLVQSPPDEPNVEPQLADRLYEIVKLYLNPRLLSRDKFAAVALNAILSLCLLRSSHADEVRQALKELPVSWFSELVLRRASQIQKTLYGKLPTKQAARCAEQLAALNGETALSEG